MKFEITPTRKVFTEKAKKLKNPELWQQYVEKNKDSYGKCCVDVARRVMEILDENEIPLLNDCHTKEENAFTSFNIISQAEEDIGSGGITGFMASCVMTMVRHCHNRGDEFYDSCKDQLQ